MGLCRMIKEIAVFLFLSHCVICIDFQHDSTSVLDPGGTVRIVCDIGVANFTASVTLLKDGSPKTVCDNANTCGPSNSDSNRYQYTSNASAVTVEIFNLTQPSDDGLWTCNLGSISSANYSLTVSTPVNPGNGDKCLLLLYALLPIDLITLFGTIIVIVVACCLDKDGKLSESSMEESCGCCPHKNKFCMCMCPLCTDPLCTGSKKTDSSVILKNIISVVGFTLVAVIIGLIIAYGLGLDSGKCIPALILSIICGLALVAIFTVSVYPHWPCLPEKGSGGFYNLCGR